MTAYTAVISLRNTIERILDSSRISLVPPSPQMIRLVCRELKSLKKLLERLDSSSKSKSRKKVNALDARIKEAVWRFEDLLESLLSDQILSQLESSGGGTDVLPLFSIDLQSLRCDVDTFIEAAKEMQKEYTYELDNMPDEEEEDEEEEEEEEIVSKFLFTRYYYLPQYLKLIFFTLGTFPQQNLVHVSKLVNMLTAEGLIEQFKTQSSKEFVSKCLNELCQWSNICIVHQKIIGFYGKICLNPSWQKLCTKEGGKNKFFHVLNSRVDGIKGQRRLCLRSNFVFNMKKVYNSVKCDCASTARSLLCFGPYHPYSMPLDVGFKLLRVLDALNVRFYNFPIQILELVLLQYLALTYNGELPTSISNLFSLQFLIICPYMNIQCCRAPSHLPVQIWDMQELKHIKISGRSLPHPNSNTSLQKLSTLLGVSVSDCTKEVLEKIPNVKTLGIEIQLTPNDDHSNPLRFFDHISQLGSLERLSCEVMNPNVKYGLVASLTPPSTLPSRLNDLCLSGFGYSWKYIKVIGSLPNLETLTLRCHAFRGPKWGTKKRSFMSLKYLVIDDMDLVEWKPRRGSFPKLRTLSIRHCYKLQELRWPCAAGSGQIQLVDCNPLAVTCAKQLQTGNKSNKNIKLVVSAQSSF